jgi:hypothetical protein
VTAVEVERVVVRAGGAVEVTAGTFSRRAKTGQMGSGDAVRVGFVSSLAKYKRTGSLFGKEDNSAKPYVHFALLALSS